MGRLNTWVDWSVLALCMVAAAGAAVDGIGALDVRIPTPRIHEHPAVAALAVIAGLTLLNCGFLLGAALCKARQDAQR
jgi:hypothetical protein